MRILQVCHRYPPSVGGVEEHVRHISERLASDHEVTVFACDPSGRLPREQRVNGVLVRRFRSLSPGGAYHLSLSMLRDIRASDFDVVHGHNYHAFPLHLSRHARSRRVVVTPHYHGHGHTPLRGALLRLWRPFGRRALETADAVVAVSRFERDLLRRHFRIPEQRLHLVPNGVDLGAARGAGRVERDRTAVLYVGRLERYKGPQYAVMALPALGPAYRLDVVGMGPYERELRALARRLSVEDRVRFHGELPREGLLRRYASAGVLVLLSEHEASSLVVAEALAAGTPCVVANASGLAEWIDGETCVGIELPPSANRLAGLVRDVAGREVSGIELRDWDRVAAELQQVYAAG